MDDSKVTPRIQYSFYHSDGASSRNRGAWKQRLHLMFLCSLFLSVTWAADISGRWTGGGKDTFVLTVAGDKVSGLIDGGPGRPSYKIVDGKIEDEQVSFFVLHDADSDPEVKANGGKSFRNWVKGTISGDELSIFGAREYTNERAFKQILRRVKSN